MTTAIAILVALCAWGCGLVMQLTLPASPRPWVWTLAALFPWVSTFGFDLSYRTEMDTLGGSDLTFAYLVAACSGSFAGTQAAIELRAHFGSCDPRGSGHTAGSS